MADGRQGESDRTLLDWLGVIRDGWYALVVCIAVGLPAGFAATSLQSTEYGADGTVLVSSHEGFLDPGTADTLPALADTVARLATTPVVLSSTATSFVAAAGPSTSTPAAQRRETATIDWLRAHLSARQIGTSSIIQVTGTGPTQDWATDLTSSAITTLRTIVNKETPASVKGGIELRVFSEAEPLGRTSPTPLRNAFIGFNVGLILGVATALLVGSRRRRLRDPHAIAAALDAPLLGVIGGTFGDNDQLKLDLAEIRERLLYRRGEGTFLVTGMVPAPDLNTVSTLLAQAATERFAQTTLVDGTALLNGALDAKGSLRFDGKLKVIGSSNTRRSTRPTQDARAAIATKLKKLTTDSSFVVVSSGNLDARSDLVPFIVTVDSIVLVARLGTREDRLEATRWLLADLDRKAEGVIVVDRRVASP